MGGGPGPGTWQEVSDAGRFCTKCRDHTDAFPTPSPRAGWGQTSRGFRPPGARSLPTGPEGGTGLGAHRKRPCSQRGTRGPSWRRLDTGASNEYKLKSLTTLSVSDHVGRLPSGRELVSRAGCESKAQGLQCQAPRDPQGGSDRTTQDAPSARRSWGRGWGVGKGSFLIMKSRAVATIRHGGPGKGRVVPAFLEWAGQRGCAVSFSSCRFGTPGVGRGVEGARLTRGTAEVPSFILQGGGRMFRRPWNWPKAAVGRDSAFWQRALVGGGGYSCKEGKC